MGHATINMFKNCTVVVHGACVAAKKLQASVAVLPPPVRLPSHRSCTSSVASVSY